MPVELSKLLRLQVQKEQKLLNSKRKLKTSIATVPLTPRIRTQGSIRS